MKSELETTKQKPAILALIRQILIVAGTALVAKDCVRACDIEPVIGALLTIRLVVWRWQTSGGDKSQVAFGNESCGFPAFASKSRP